MKRILITVVALAAAAVPATSSAGTSAKEGDAASRGGQNLQISFTVRSLDGKPVKIKKFEFKNLTATCDVGGPVDVKGDLPTMKINDAGKFDGKVTDGAAKVVVEGQVKKQGKKVEGTIRAKGDFSPAEGCDSGKVNWKAN